MVVLSERTAHGSLPITKVIEYAAYIGFKDVALMTSIINKLFSSYSAITNKRNEKERIKANG
tara:strand:+ start:238 stop:423 length:186 start_codon:yes stop_codon:yes gene_type:complete